MSGMKILITGASGFVGGALVRHFSGPDFQKKAKAEVWATGRSRLENGIFGPETAYFSVDLAKNEPFPAEFEKAEIILHSAGLADDRSSRAEFFEANVAATERLLRAATSCRKFIFISSASVYLPSDDGHFLTENEAVSSEKLSLYGQSKLAAERAAEKICAEKGAAFVALRPRAIYGPGDRVLLPRLLKLMRGERLFLPGPCAVETSMTHVENLVAAAEKALFSTIEKPLVLNIADREPYFLRQILVELFESIFEKKPRPTVVSLAFLQFLASFFERTGIRGPISRQSLEYLSKPCRLDISAAKREISWSPTVDFFSKKRELGCWARGFFSLPTGVF